MLERTSGRAKNLLEIQAQRNWKEEVNLYFLIGGAHQKIIF